MSAISFFGYLFLGVGPGVVFYFFFIATKSFLVLLSLFSAFYWLVILLLISAIYKGFEPLTASVGVYAGVLVGAVTIQEIARYLLWLLNRKCVDALDAIARANGMRLTILDKLYIALAWGWGHGACQVTFLFLYIISLSTGDGTLYLDTCPSMSMLLSGALSALGIGLTLPALMVIGLDGYHTGNLLNILCAPIVHYIVSLMTLINFQRNGCLAAVPTLIGIGLCSVARAIHLAWSKGAPYTATTPLNPQPSEHDSSQLPTSSSGAAQWQAASASLTSVNSRTPMRPTHSD